MGQLFNREPEQEQEDPIRYAAIYGNDTNNPKGWCCMKYTDSSQLYQYWRKFPFPKRKLQTLEEWIKEETPDSTGCWEGWQFEHVISLTPIDHVVEHDRLNTRDGL